MHQDVLLLHQLLEVLAVGIPIVTTRVGGNPEVIEDGVNGLLVPYNNHKALEQAMLRILGNREEAARFVAEGKKSLKKFSEERMINAIEQLIKQTRVTLKTP